MKLFSKEIDKKLFKQYPKGEDLSSQVAVAKIFNPYGVGRWYLVNSDESDPDYIWAVVQMGNVVEVGSVSRKQLESLRIKPFNLPLERDLSFGGVNASELFKGLSAGKFYKAGGWTEGSENKEMLLNQAEGFEHHAEELESAVKKADYVPAWVVAKSQRASTDLSDITHYLDGENEQREEEMEGEEEYGNGGIVGGLTADESIYLYVKKAIVQKYREKYLKPAGLLGTPKSKYVEQSLIKKGFLNNAGAITELGKNKAREVDSEIGLMISRGYISSTNLPSKYKEIVEKFESDDKMASGGMMAKGGYIEFEEIIPEKKLIDLLKSIDFKTFNSKEIKFITRKEIIEKPKYRQFEEEIHVSTVGEGVDILFSNFNNSVGYNVSIWVTFRMGRQIIPQHEYVFNIENLNFSEFEKGLKKAVKENIVTLMVDNGADVYARYNFYFKGKEQDAEKFALNEGYEKVYYKTEEKYYKDLKNRKNTAERPSFEKYKYHEYKKEYDNYGFSYFYYNPKFDFENEKSKLIRNNIKRPSELHLGRFTDAKVKNIGITKIEKNENLSSGEKMADGGMMAKGGKTEPDETVYIEYFNKAKKFAKDKKEFTGQNAYNEAVSWGRKNIGNFNLDMVKFKMASGGMMAKGGEIELTNKDIFEKGKIKFYEFSGKVYANDRYKVIPHIKCKFLVEYKGKMYEVDGGVYEDGDIKILTSYQPMPLSKSAFESKFEDSFEGGWQTISKYKPYKSKNDLIKSLKNDSLAFEGKMADGGMMAKGGIVAIEKKGDKKVATIIHNGNVFFVEYYIDNPEIKHIKGDDANTYFSVVDNKYSYGKSDKEYIAVTKKLINAIKNNKVAYYEEGGKMAMGGKVKFADKVKSIKASLLERKKVSPKVQKDYGKTYSPKEAEESAKRIVGAMTAKERLMAKKKKK